MISVKDGKWWNFLEVDLEYPKDLHDVHNDYPLPPEKLAVNSEMLLGYCKKIANKYWVGVGNVKKLIPNLGTRKIMCFITKICSCIYH